MLCRHACAKNVNNGASKRLKGSDILVAKKHLHMLVLLFRRLVCKRKITTRIFSNYIIKSCGPPDQHIQFSGKMHANKRSICKKIII